MRQQTRLENLQVVQGAVSRFIKLVSLGLPSLNKELFGSQSGPIAAIWSARRYPII